jgi:hypothetical protein
MKIRLWKVIHYLIITNFLVEIVYSVIMVFFVIGGGKVSLLRRAVETPVEIILKRRLYAIEAWIAIGALCVYLALTVYLPLLLRDINSSNSQSEASIKLEGYGLDL